MVVLWVFNGGFLGFYSIFLGLYRVYLVFVSLEFLLGVFLAFWIGI